MSISPRTGSFPAFAISRLYGFFAAMMVRCHGTMYAQMVDRAYAGMVRFEESRVRSTLLRCSMRAVLGLEGGRFMLSREARVQPPALEGFSDVPLFNTKAVVHQTGVPAPTLRAWERRYGILSPHRGENDYRLYSERDIATVAWLRQRVESGMTISQAIALLHSLEPARHKRRHANGQPGIPAAPPFANYTSQPAAQPTAERLDFTTLSAVLLRHFVQLNDDAANRTIAQALA